jgi:hypothetical protein
LLYYFKPRIRFRLLTLERKAEKSEHAEIVGIMPRSDSYLSFSHPGFKATSRQVQKYDLSKKL